jgi:hypothetical protein
MEAFPWLTLYQYLSYPTIRPPSPNWTVPPAVLELPAPPALPTYEYRQPLHTRQTRLHELNAPEPGVDHHAHELAVFDSSPPMQPSSLHTATPATPADVRPAIVVPTPYREEEARLEQLRAQKAAVARERERKEEIDRIRAEEKRLERAIAELESRR